MGNLRQFVFIKYIRVHSCVFMCIRVQKKYYRFLNFLDKRRLMFFRVLARGKGLSGLGKGIKGKKERLFWMLYAADWWARSGKLVRNMPHFKRQFAAYWSPICHLLVCCRPLKRGRNRGSYNQTLHYQPFTKTAHFCAIYGRRAGRL